MRIHEHIESFVFTRLDIRPSGIDRSTVRPHTNFTGMKVIMTFYWGQHTDSF